MTRAWTLGNRTGYERAVRMPGNAKAPGGYAFRSREEAEAYVRQGGYEYGVWEMELPGSFDDCTTDSYAVAARARHAWHQQDAPASGRWPRLSGCGVCEPWRAALEGDLDCRLLTVVAPFVNPDTGEVA